MEQCRPTGELQEKAQALANELGCAAGDNAEVAAESEYIFLGVKPQMMADMLLGIAPALAARTDRFVLATLAVTGFREGMMMRKKITDISTVSA